MFDNKIKLIEPTEAMFDAWIDFVAEFSAAGEEVIHGGGGIDPVCATAADLGAAVQLLKNYAKGIGLKKEWVPASTYWLVRDGRILGTCNLRHRLNEFLRMFGGHIGYSVRPSERGKGYGSLQLRLALAEARRRGIDRALITCGKANVASAGVIVANGGVFEGEALDPTTGGITQRYWVDLGSEGVGR